MGFACQCHRTNRHKQNDQAHPIPLMRSLLTTVAAVTSLSAVLACDKASSRVRHENVAATAAVRAPAVAQASKGPLPYYLDPLEDCGFLQTTLFPDPVALVHHYVEEDNVGRFLESTPLTDSVYTCPGHLPGPDEFTVVSSSEVQPLTSTDSSARVLVRSVQFGKMMQDSAGWVFVRDMATVVDTFVVLHTTYGWRIESPELPGRVLGTAVLARAERFHLRPQVRDSLVAAASRPGA